MGDDGQTRLATRIVGLDEIKEGDQLADGVISRGRVLLPIGTILDSRHINRLREWGVGRVCVTSPITFKKHGQERDALSIGDIQFPVTRQRLKVEGKRTVVDGNLIEPIKTPGPLEVRGDVLQGVRVIAGGDVLILGSVHGAHVHSVTGDVRVKIQCTGDSRNICVIDAEKDIEVGNAWQAAFQSRTGNVRIRSEVFECKIQAAKDVVIGRYEFVEADPLAPSSRLLAATRIIAGSTIRLASAGVPDMGPVELVIEGAGQVCLEDEVDALRSQLAKLEKDRSMLAQDLAGSRMELRQKKARRTLREIDMMASDLEQIEKQIHEIPAKIKALQTKTTQLVEEQKIAARFWHMPVRVWGSIQPGTSIEIGGLRMDLGRSEYHAGFFRDDRIRMTSDWVEPFPEG